MILDTVHLLHEAGYDVLPNNKSPLKQGWVRPPNSMDGIPAPLSITVNPQDSIIAKVRTYYLAKPSDFAVGIFEELCKNIAAISLSHPF